MARFARNPETGEIVRLDMRTGEWVPATPEDITIAQRPVVGRGIAAAQGAGLLNLGFGAEDRAALGEAAETAFPGSALAGNAAALAATIPLAGNAVRLVRGMGLANRGASVAATTNQGQRVARNLGDVIRGEAPGPVRRAVGGLGDVAQAAGESSKILRGLFGGTRFAPNVQRGQAAVQAMVRGAGGSIDDLTRQGEITRGAFGNLVRKNAQQFDDAIIDPGGIVAGPKDLASVRNMLKPIPRAEREILGAQMARGELTAKQLKSWREEMVKLSSKAQQDTIRTAANNIVKRLDELAEKSKGIIDTKVWKDAREKWRFIQALRQAQRTGEFSFRGGQSGLRKFFRKEFEEGNLAGLSDEGREAIETIIRIEEAGGVRTFPEGLSAVDFLLGGAAGAGIVR